MAKQSTAHQRIPDPARRAQLHAAAQRRSRARAYRRLAVPAALAIAGIATAVTLSLVHHRGPTPPKAVSTIAGNKNTCLLADPGQAQALTVLTGMQQAATRQGNVNVQQTTLPPGTTDAAPELAGLIQQHCAVVVAIGPLSTQALQAAADNHTAVGAKLVEISATKHNQIGVTVLPPTGLTATAITQALTTALR